MGVAAHVCAQTERDVSKTETSTANADAIPRVHSAQKRHLRRSFAVSLFGILLCLSAATPLAPFVEFPSIIQMTLETFTRAFMVSRLGELPLPGAAKTCSHGFADGRIANKAPASLPAHLLRDVW